MLFSRKAKDQFYELQSWIYKTASHGSFCLLSEETGQSKKMTSSNLKFQAKPRTRLSKTGKSENQNPVHITIVGAPKVGKSALAVRLLTNRFIGYRKRLCSVFANFPL